MRLFMGRPWRVPSGKIPGLTRIAMPGSSMTAGYGVSFDQAMPAQLERLLNAGPGDTLFQVVNCGVNNSTAWNSLTDLMHRPVFYDVLVQELSVTNANIYRRTFNKRYATMTAARWRDGTPTNELVRKHLRQAAEHFAARGIPFALVFYIHRDNRVSREMQKHIQQLCDENNLPLIHTLDLYDVPVGEQVSLDVSGADLHPSPKSHGIAAAHIAAELAKMKALTQQRPPSTVQLAPRRIADIMAAMQAQGEPLDVILPWAQAALDAKRSVAGLEPDWRVRDNFEREADQLGQRLARLRGAWRQAGRAAAFAGLAGTPESIVDHRLREVMDDMLRADEVAITVGTPHEPWSAGLLTDLLAGRPAEPPAPPPPPGLIETARDLARQLSRAERDLVEAQADPALSPIRQHVTGYLPAAAEVTALATDYMDILEAIESSRRALTQAHAADAAENKEQLPFQVAQECLNRAANHVRLSMEDMQNFMLGAGGIDSFVTNFVLRWQTEPRKTAQRFDITIEVKSIVPQRPILRHHATLFEDGTEQVITFRLPMLFTGQMSVNVWGRNDGMDRIQGLRPIEVYSDPSTVTLLHLEEAFRRPWGTAVFPVFTVR